MVFWVNVNYDEWEETRHAKVLPNVPRARVNSDGRPGVVESSESYEVLNERPKMDAAKNWCRGPALGIFAH